eukprot:GHUV01037640.1.p1 GENE.GHUV01037640.1~~GHUV01037640.1.p1  ORF type:complete len:143 (+),score=22.41 GHUV01037640.1:346-774(+)
MMWSLYLRVDNPYVRKLYVATSVRGRIGQEIAYAFAYGFILLTLCLSWFIGMTRFWDNVHAVSDILGGFLIAIIFSTPLVVKSIGWHVMIQSEIDDAVTSTADNNRHLHDDALSVGQGVIANGNGHMVQEPQAEHNSELLPS